MKPAGMSIAENLRKLKSQIPGQVRIVAVSKRKSVEEILEAYQEGQRIFGENRAQELIEKQPRLPEDIQWHMVGHLQTNKVKYLAGFVSLIQSVDSLKLLLAIEREALKTGRVIPCLLQIRIAREESKFGLTQAEALELVGSQEFRSTEHVRIDGVMGMATYTTDLELVASEFRFLKEVFGKLKERCFKDSDNFRELSMGMSGDYTTAIREGSTMVRLGTLIFGAREY